MVATFNAVAFQGRIDKAHTRAVKASVRSSDMDQRISKRKERLEKAMEKARKGEDEALRTATVDKVKADVGMAECDQKKAALNAVKLSAYVRQLTREGELKAQRAQQKGEKGSKAAAVWAFRTPDGTTTSIANTDGSFGRIVGRSKSVAMAPDTFAFLLGDEVVDLLNDVGGNIVCNELAYGVTIPESGNVVLTRQ
jgi:hypothetical protein